MKKILKIVILALTISLMIAGCSKKVDETDPQASKISTPSDDEVNTSLSEDENTQDSYKIGLCLYKYDDSFEVRTSIENAALEKEISADCQILISSTDAAGGQSTQNDQIDSFITQDYDVLIVNLVDLEADSLIIDKAKNANIPMIFFGNEPAPENMAKWDKLYYIGSRAEHSGTIQGQIAASLFKSGGIDKNSDNKMQYVMIEGTPGERDVKLRSQYSIKEVEVEGIDIEKLANDTAMYDRDIAKEKLTSWIPAFGDKIEVVFASNDDMALGVIDAFKNAGYFADGEKHIPVIGFGATPAAIDSLEKGELAGTVYNDPDILGNTIFDIAYTLAVGEKPTPTDDVELEGKYCWIPYHAVTLENVSDFKK